MFFWFAKLIIVVKCLVKFSAIFQANLTHVFSNGAPISDNINCINRDTARVSLTFGKTFLTVVTIVNELSQVVAVNAACLFMAS